jgi:hypothetical protein
MKVSELIKYLEEMKHQYGDVECIENYNRKNGHPVPLQYYQKIYITNMFLLNGKDECYLYFNITEE